MGPVDVEDVPRVAEAVRFRIQAGRGPRLDREVEEPLPPVLARLQAEQHHALPRGGGVAVAGDVFDLVTDGCVHCVQRAGGSSIA